MGYGVAPTAVDPDALLAIGRGLGLDALGITSADAFPEARRALETRKAAGLHGGMGFTYRNPARATDPGLALPDAASVIVAAKRYRTSPRPGRRLGPTARVAAYARRDVYAELKVGPTAMGRELKRAGWRARVLVDDNVLVDRAAAQRAGLGWFGKNANVLVPGIGSWVVLGCLVTDARLESTSPDPVPDGCGPCTRCLTGCPTEAIVAPGVIDARRCLAWLVQAPGTFPAEHRVALGDRLYGCDDCQDVCPPNRLADRADPPPIAPADDLDHVDVVDLLAADDDTLLERFGRWYIAGREPRWLRRNALLILGNVADPGDERVTATLADHLRHDDPMLRAHATWAARRLGRDDLLPVDEVHPDVLVERRALVAARP